MSFKIGDRVKCVRRPYGDYVGKGYNMLGTIKGFIGPEKGVPTQYYSAFCDIIGIEFDEDIGGHTCDGIAKDKHGWYLNKAYIIKINTLGMAHRLMKHEFV